MIIQTLVIAFYVIIVNIVLQAFLPDVSKQLGPYVGLIITNCIIMGRAEAYAAKNPPLVSMLDGLFAGAGYTVVLLAISVIRETLGFGTVFGMKLPISFTPWTIMVMPPAAFFIIGIFIWALNNYQTKQEQKKGIVRSGSLTIQKKKGVIRHGSSTKYFTHRHILCIHRYQQYDLSNFLGMCSYLSVSSGISTTGLGGRRHGPGHHQYRQLAFV